MTLRSARSQCRRPVGLLLKVKCTVELGVALDDKERGMAQLRLGSVCVMTFGLLSGAIRADEPKKPPADPVIALIDQLTEVSRQDTGYSGSMSGASFLPLGQRAMHTMLFGQQANAESDAMRSLVSLGVKAVPALLEHLSDDRKTKIVIEHQGIFGGFFIGQDEGEKAEEKSGKGFNEVKRYTLRVGDLCYVALGQIVNAGYSAVRYQPTAIIFATSVPHSKQLRADLLKEWSDLTADKHRDLLAKDLGSDGEDERDGASLRLAYYYPQALEPLALKQLARPTYDVFAVSNLIRDHLYPAKTAKDRKALVDEFVKKHGEIARDGIIWDLFQDLDTQEADEEGRLSPKLDPKYKARECLIEVFGLAANVKSKDRPKAEPLAFTSQARFVRTLLYDRSGKLDQALRDILAKTDDDYMAEGCLSRLVGRGYDADIEAYLKRRLSRVKERDRGDLKRFEAKLGWTRLHAAVELNVPEVIEAALLDKLDVNARGRDGRTALHLAAADGKVEAVKLLLKAKANVNVKDGQGRLAIQLAARADHPEVVRRLLAAKSEQPDVFAAATVGDAARLGELLKGNRELVKERNANGYTPLHVAAREGHADAIRTLLSAGADVNAVDVETKDSGYPEGWTPLHLAVLFRKTKVAELLLDKGAKANAADRRGRLTPLHYAAWSGDVELARVLLAGKADRGARDEKARTPLDLAKERQHSAVVKLLEESK
jgi:ankyrin repeat protein